MSKTFVRITAVALLVTMLVCTLASCGGLSGTYSTEVFGSGASYTFKGSKVTIDVKALGSVVATFEGKYKVDGDKITFTFEDEDAKEYSGEFTFEKGDDYVKIGLIKYNEVK